MAEKQSVDAILIRMEADLQSFRSELVAGQKTVAQTAKNIEGALNEMSKKSGGSFKFLKDAAATAAGFIGGQAVLGALKNAAGAMVGFFTSGMDEAIAQEDAVQRINMALAQSGKFTRDASEAMQDYASSMQASTKFGDDVVLESAALIQSLGRLETEGLKGATTAALDMATALKIDLKAAATLVGKAAVGEVSSLSRYGIVVEAGASKAETFARALEAINRQFGGSAAGAVKTYSGATAQLSNNYGDVKEELALTVTQSGAVVGAIGAISQAFSQLSLWVKDNKAGLQELIKDGIIMLADGIPIAAKAIEKLSESFATAYRFGQSLRGFFNDLVGDSEGANDAIQKIFESQQNDNTRAEMFAKLGEEAQKLRDKIVDAAENGAAAQELVNTQLEHQSQLAAIAQEATDALTETERTRLEAQIEAGAKLIEQEETFNTDYMALLEARQAAEAAALEKQLSEGLISKQQFEAQKTALEARGADDRVKLSKSEADRKFQIEQQQLKAVSGILANGAEIAKAFGKDGFEAYKALAKAQATIDAIAAAQAAYKSTLEIPVIGPVLAPVAAATALGVGMARVAAINAQGFAKGGEVPGIGFGDSVPAMLTPKETVVDRSTTSKMKKFFGGDNALLEEIRGLRADFAALMRFPERFQIVDLDGRRFFDVINAELRGGRKFATGGV